MMRKILSTAFVLMLTLALCLSAAACGKKPPVNPSPAPSTSVTVPASPSAPTVEPSKSTEPSTPTVKPSPSNEPTQTPTTEPTQTPTTEPTVEPTTEPSVEPSVKPTTPGGLPDFDNMDIAEFEEWVRSCFTDATITYDGESHTIAPNFPEGVELDWEYVDGEDCVDAGEYYPEIYVSYGDLEAQVAVTLTIDKADVIWTGDDTQTFEADGEVKKLVVSVNTDAAISGNDGRSEVGTYQITLSVGSGKNYKASEKTFTLIITGLTADQAKPVFMIGDEVYDPEIHGGSQENPLTANVGHTIELPEGFKVMSNTAVEGYEKFAPTDITAASIIVGQAVNVGDFFTGKEGVTIADFIANEYKYSIGGTVTLTITASNEIYGGFSNEMTLYFKVENGEDVPKDNAFDNGNFADSSLSDWFGWNAQEWAKSGTISVDYLNPRYFDGTGALHIDATCGNGNLNKVAFVKGGYYYTISFWYRATADYKTTSGADAHVYLVQPNGWNGWDANGVPNNHDANTSVGKYEMKELVQIPAEWTYYEYTFKAEEDSYYGFNIKTNGMMRGEVWFDEIALYVVGETPAVGNYWTYEEYSTISAGNANVISSAYEYKAETTLEGVSFTYLLKSEDGEWSETPMTECVINPDGSIFRGQIKVIAHMDGKLLDYYRVVDVVVIDAGLPAIPVRYLDSDGETEISTDTRRPGETFLTADEYKKDGYVFMGWQLLDEEGNPGEVYGWKTSIDMPENTDETAGLTFVATYVPVNTGNMAKNGEIKDSDPTSGWGMDFTREYDPTVSYLADGTGSVHYYSNGAQLNAQMKMPFSAQRGVTYVMSFAAKASSDFEVNGSFDSGNCIISSKQGDLDGSGFTYSTGSLVGTKGWQIITWEWTAPFDDNFNIFWKMHGVVMGEVWFDHFVVMEKNAYADYKTTWTSDMAETTTVPSGSVIGDAELGGYNFVASTTLEGATITYRLGEGEEVETLETLPYGVHTVSVIFRKEGYLDYVKTVEVSVVNPDSAKYEVTFVDSVDNSTIETMSDVVENSEITLPEAAIHDGYLFRGWKIGEQTYKPGDIVRIAENTTVYALFDEISFDNAIRIPGDVTLGQELMVNDGYTTSVEMAWEKSAQYAGKMWGWNTGDSKYMNISSDSYYYDGTGSIEWTMNNVPGNDRNMWTTIDMYLQEGVTYEIGFWYAIQGYVTSGSNTNIFFTDAPREEIKAIKTLTSEVFTGEANKDWTHLSFTHTATRTGYHSIFFHFYGLSADSFKVDEVTAYPVGYTPNDKETQYWTATEAAKAIAEDRTVQLVDGKATYDGASAPEGITIKYVMNEVEYDKIEVTENTDTDIIVRFTNANGVVLEKTAHFIALESLENKTITFESGAEEATGEVAPVSGLYNSKVILPESSYTYADHVFEGWMINGKLYLAGAEFVLSDDFTATATWTEIVYGNLLSNPQVDSTYTNNDGWIDAGGVKEFDATNSYYADGTGSIKISATKDTSNNIQLLRGFKAVKGVNYIFSVTVKTENFKRSSSYGAAAFIRKDGVNIMSIHENGYDSGKLPLDSDWTTYTVKFTAPATGDYDFQLQMHGVLPGGAIWYDNLAVYAEGSDMTYNYLTTAEAATCVANDLEIPYDGEEHTYTATAGADIEISYILNEVSYTELKVKEAGTYNVTVVFAKGERKFTKNVTISVVNEEEKFTVTFKNGETVVETREDVVGNTSITLREAPENKGYLFTGWELDGEKYAAGASVIITKDSEFVATWKELLTTNRFMFDGSISSAVSTKDDGGATSLEKIESNKNVIWGWNANTAISSRSYYDDGTGAYALPTGAATTHFWMYLQGGVTYNVSFWYTYTGMTNRGDDTHLKLGDTVLSPATGTDYYAEIFSVNGDKAWTKFTAQLTVKEDGYYDMWYQSRVTATEVLADEFSCYPVGYEPADKSAEYWTEDEVKTLVAENKVATMVDGAATYDGASAPEGIKIQYSLDGEVFEDTFTTEEDGEFELTVRFTNARGLTKDLKATFTVYSDKIPATFKFSANEVTVSELEGKVVGDVVTMIDLDAQYIPEGYRFDGWKIGDATLAVGDEFTIVDPATTATAILTKLVYGEMMENPYDHSKWNAKWGGFAQFNANSISWTKAEGGDNQHGHEHYYVNLQKGVTYQLSFVVNGTMTVSSAGGCNFQFWMAKGDSNEGNLNQVSDTLEIAGQGKSVSYENQLFKTTYTCTEDGKYTVSFRTWSIAAANMTLTDLSLKAINPNAIDGGELVTNGALTSGNGWSYDGGGANGWMGISYEFGENGLAFKGNGNGYAVQKIHLVAGVPYTLTYWTAANDAFLSSNQSDVRITAETTVDQSAEIVKSDLIPADGARHTFGWEKRTVNFSVSETKDYYLSVHAYSLSGGILYVKNVSVRYNGDLVDATFDGDISALTDKWDGADRASFTYDKTVSATEDGTGSLKIQGLGTLDNGRTDGLTTNFKFGFKVVNGKTYKITFDYRGDNIGESGVNELIKVLKPTDNTDEVDGYGYRRLNWCSIESGKWIHFDDFTFTATEDSDLVLFFRLYGMAGTAYIDNVKVTEVNDKVENIPAEKPAAPEKEVTMIDFKGTYTDTAATNTFVVGANGACTLNGDAHTYIVSAENQITIGGFTGTNEKGEEVEVKVVATYTDGTFTFTVDGVDYTLSK